MKNIDKEPTYYVSLTEYNEVKRMFLKANDEINTLKELLSNVRIYVYIGTQYDDNQPVVDKVALKLLGEIDRLLGDKTDDTKNI